MKVLFLSEGSEGMEKGIKYNQDQPSIMLLLELNFRHNAVDLRVTLKSIILKISSIMYLTLFHKMKTRSTLTVILCFCSQYKRISKQCPMCCSIGVCFFVKGTSVCILNVMKTIDCILKIDFLILCS